MIEISKCRLTTSPVAAWGEIHGDINDQKDLIEKIQEAGGVSKQYVDNEIARVEGEIPSLTGYATEEWVEAKGFLTEHQPIKTLNGESLVGDGDIVIEADVTKEYVDNEIERVEGKIPSLEGYATESWVEAKGYLTEHQDITGKANITYVDSEISRVEGEIPSLTGYATEDWVEAKGYLTEHQDITGKQDVLVSGENIKTINNESILGSGNIEIEAGALTPEQEEALEPHLFENRENGILYTNVIDAMFKDFTFTFDDGYDGGEQGGRVRRLVGFNDNIYYLSGADHSYKMGDDFVFHKITTGGEDFFGNLIFEDHNGNVYKDHNGIFLINDIETGDVTQIETTGSHYSPLNYEDDKKGVYFHTANATYNTYNDTWYRFNTTTYEFESITVSNAPYNFLERAIEIEGVWYYITGGQAYRFDEENLTFVDVTSNPPYPLTVYIENWGDITANARHRVLNTGSEIVFVGTKYEYILENGEWVQRYRLNSRNYDLEIGNNCWFVYNNFVWVYCNSQFTFLGNFGDEIKNTTWTKDYNDIGIADLSKVNTFEKEQHFSNGINILGTFLIENNDYSYLGMRNTGFSPWYSSPADNAFNLGNKDIISTLPMKLNAGGTVNNSPIASLKDTISNVVESPIGDIFDDDNMYVSGMIDGTRLWLDYDGNLNYSDKSYATYKVYDYDTKTWTDKTWNIEFYGTTVFEYDGTIYCTDLWNTYTLNESTGVWDNVCPCPAELMDNTWKDHEGNVYNNLDYYFTGTSWENIYIPSSDSFNRNCVLNFPDKTLHTLYGRVMSFDISTHSWTYVGNTRSSSEVYPLYLADGIYRYDSDTFYKFNETNYQWDVYKNVYIGNNLYASKFKSIDGKIYLINDEFHHGFIQGIEFTAPEPEEDNVKYLLSAVKDGTSMTYAYNTSIWTGTSSEWNDLTQEEQETYTIALITND